MDLNRVSTCEIVSELSKRQGVEMIIAEPYQDKAVSVNGPAIILVVTD